MPGGCFSKLGEGLLVLIVSACYGTLLSLGVRPPSARFEDCPGTRLC